MIQSTATLTLRSFLSPSSDLTKEDNAHLRPLGDLRILGKQWALWASKQVLRDIDQPTLGSTQICQVLALYWFAVGDSQRSMMFAGWY